MSYTYEYFQKSADYVKSIVPYTPEVAIVLGSCLGPFADTIEDPIVIDYKPSQKPQRYLKDPPPSKQPM